MNFSLWIFFCFLIKCFHLCYGDFIEQYPEVVTRLGNVRGSLMQTRLGKRIYAFRGIPYAEPPIGNLRFKQSVPKRPWGGIYDATEEGPACPQAYGVNLSEDCLVLNIYTKRLPSLSKNDNNTAMEKLPVIVFMHPGALYQMSGQSFVFGPQYLLDQDIVLVTINYRLAALGFLNLGDEHASGNLGFKDQVLALRLVRDNIATFGGDPNLITLAGQSAGSRSLILHLVSPMSKGLFHRAIGMSGSSTTKIPAQQRQLDLARKQAKFVGCTMITIEKMFNCLMKTPAEKLGSTTKMFKEYQDHPELIWYPSVEPDIPGQDRFLSMPPEDLIRAGQINEVPVIFSTTKDEFIYKTHNAIEDALQGNHSTFRDFTTRWDELAPICLQYERGTRRSKLISRILYKEYFNKEPISLENVGALSQIFTDATVRFPMYKALTLLSNYSRTPVYYYEFNYQGRYSGAQLKKTGQPLGVAHGDDLQYLFYITPTRFYQSENYRFFNESDPEIVMVEKLTTMWANFAKYGKPFPDSNDGKQNTWIPFTLEDKQYLEMEDSDKLKTHPHADRMKLWTDLFPY